MTEEEKRELKNAVHQVIHHQGHGVGNSEIATVLRELADYYDD